LHVRPPGLHRKIEASGMPSINGSVQSTPAAH
jgi:hypothetical protein